MGFYTAYPPPQVTPAPNPTPTHNVDQNQQQQQQQTTVITVNESKPVDISISSNALVADAGPSRPVETVSTTPSRNKRQTCKICGKTLSSPSSYYVHMKLHSGTKPFACTIDDLAMSTKVLWQAKTCSDWIQELVKSVEKIQNQIGAKQNAIRRVPAQQWKHGSMPGMAPILSL